MSKIGYMTIKKSKSNKPIQAVKKLNERVIYAISEGFIYIQKRNFLNKTVKVHKRKIKENAKGLYFQYLKTKVYF
jgi:hypothetical protein